MKKLLGIVSGLLVLLSNPAQSDTVKACVMNANKLPIRNIALNPTCKLQVTYSFQPEMNVLLCLSNVLHDSGRITWPYQGKLHSAELPVILSRNGKDTTTLIDGSGKFSIENNQQKQLVVSCQYSRGVSDARRARAFLQAATRVASARCAQHEMFA